MGWRENLTQRTNSSFRHLGHTCRKAHISLRPTWKAGAQNAIFGKGVAGRLSVRD